MVHHRSSRVRRRAAEGFVKDEHIGLVDDRAAQGWRAGASRPTVPTCRLSALALRSGPPAPAGDARARSLSALDIGDFTISIGSRMFCRIVRHSSSTGFWNAMPTVGRGEVTSLEWSQTLPLVRLSSGPDTSRVSVGTCRSPRGRPRAEAVLRHLHRTGCQEHRQRPRLGPGRRGSPSRNSIHVGGVGHGDLSLGYRRGAAAPAPGRARTLSAGITRGDQSAPSASCEGRRR